MEIIAIPVPHPKLSSQSRIGARLPGFITLMKPRVMALAVFTAVVGLMIAPGRLGPLLGTTDRRSAQRLFAFSILYLFVLFAALLLSNIGNRRSSTILSHAESDFTSWSRAETPAGPLDNVQSV